MRLFLSLILVFIASSLFAPKAHAIIFLPAIVLIPVAKIVALIIGGFSFPALGIGALWSRFFGKSMKKSLIFVVTLLIIIGVILALFLKIYNPDRPFF